MLVLLRGNKFGQSARAFFTGCLLLTAFFVSHSVFAANSVTIAETTRLSFGTVAIPQSGSSYLSLNPANSSLAGTGTMLFGSASRGVYTLKSTGSGSTSITIDISNVSSNSSALTLDTFTGVYGGVAIASFPSSPMSLPTSSGTLLYLGAKETATSAMTPSAPNPTFEIDITIN